MTIFAPSLPSSHFSAVSDHWWISCATSRAPCSRERGTTPPCWPPPPQTDARPKTSTPPSSRWRTTAVSAKLNVFTQAGWGEDCHIQVKRAFKSDHLVVSPPTWMVIIAAYSFLSPVPVTHVTPQVENICCGWVAVGSRSFTEVKKMNRKSSWKWNSLS